MGGGGGRRWAHGGPGSLPSDTRPHDRVPQVRDGATLILSTVGVSQQPEDSQPDLPGEREYPRPCFCPGLLSAPEVCVDQCPPSAATAGWGLLSSSPPLQRRSSLPSSLPSPGHALLEEENRVWHLVRPTDEVEEGRSKRGSVKEKERTKAITEIYLTRLLSVKVGAVARGRAGRGGPGQAGGAERLPHPCRAPCSSLWTTSSKASWHPGSPSRRQ